MVKWLNMTRRKAGTRGKKETKGKRDRGDLRDRGDQREVAINRNVRAIPLVPKVPLVSLVPFVPITPYHTTPTPVILWFCDFVPSRPFHPHRPFRRYHTLSHMGWGVEEVLLSRVPLSHFPMFWDNGTGTALTYLLYHWYIYYHYMYQYNE